MNVLYYMSGSVLGADHRRAKIKQPVLALKELMLFRDGNIL